MKRDYGSQASSVSLQVVCDTGRNGMAAGEITLNNGRFFNYCTSFHKYTEMLNITACNSLTDKKKPVAGIFLSLFKILFLYIWYS